MSAPSPFSSFLEATASPLSSPSSLAPQGWVASRSFVEQHGKMLEARAEALREHARRHMYYAPRVEARRAEDEMEAARSEAATWRLVLRLIDSGERGGGMEGVEADDDAEELFSHPRIAERAEREDAELAWQRAVVSWLEGTAAPETFYAAGPPPSPSALSGSDASSSGGGGGGGGRAVDTYMFHTKAALQATRDEDDAGVTERLDPDGAVAVRADGLGADPRDREQYADLMTSVWRLVRAGRVDSAVTLCKRRQQFWVAAMLRGDRLWSLGSGAGALGSAGNRRRFLWREACRRLAASEGATRQERAVFGALGGDAAGARRMCATWEDRCWAEFRLAVGARLDAALAAALEKRHTHAAFESRELVARHRAGEPDAAAAATSEEVFRRLDADPAMRPLGAEPYRRVQRLLILREYEALENELVRTVAGMLSKHGGGGGPAAAEAPSFAADANLMADFAGAAAAPAPGDAAEEDAREASVPRHPGSYVRMACHLCLHVHHAARPRGSPLSPDGVYLVQQMVRLLEAKGQDDLVAAYASYLPPAEQVDVYAGFLRRVRDAGHRAQLLDEAGKRHLPGTVDEIKRRLVQQIIDGKGAAAGPFFGGVAPFSAASAPRPAASVAFATPSFSMRTPGAPASATPWGGRLALDGAASTPGTALRQRTPFLPPTPLTAAAGRGGGPHADGLSEADREKIDALLCYSQLDREAVGHVNQLFRQFASNDRLAAARRLHEWVSTLPVDPAAAPDLSGPCDPATRNDRREYECWSLFVRCHAAYAHWRGHHVRRPADPARLERAARAAARRRQPTVEEEKRLGDEVEAARAASAAWLREAREARARLFDSFSETLQYPHGFLVDVRDSRDAEAGAAAAAADPGRAAYLSELRARLVPQLFQLLHGACLSSGEFQRGFNIVSLLTDPKQRLYECFSREELQHLLGEVTKSFRNLQVHGGVVGVGGGGGGGGADE